MWIKLTVLTTCAHFLWFVRDTASDVANYFHVTRMRIGWELEKQWEEKRPPPVQVPSAKGGMN